MPHTELSLEMIMCHKFLLGESLLNDLEKRGKYIYKNKKTFVRLAMFVLK